MIILTITQKSRIILQDIWRRVVGNVLINISPSNMFPYMPLEKRINQNSAAVLVAVSMSGLTYHKHKNEY